MSKRIQIRTSEYLIKKIELFKTDVCIENYSQACESLIRIGLKKWELEQEIIRKAKK